MYNVKKDEDNIPEIIKVTGFWGNLKFFSFHLLFLSASAFFTYFGVMLLRSDGKIVGSLFICLASLFPIIVGFILRNDIRLHVRMNKIQEYVKHKDTESLEKMFIDEDLWYEILDAFIEIDSEESYKQVLKIALINYHSIVRIEAIQNLYFFKDYYDTTILCLLEKFLDEVDEKIKLNIILLLGQIGENNQTVGSILLKIHNESSDDLRLLTAFSLGLIDYRQALAVLKDNLDNVSGLKERLIYSISVALIEGVSSDTLKIIDKLEEEHELDDNLESLKEFFYYKLTKRGYQRSLERRTLEEELDIDSLPQDFVKKENYTFDDVISIIRKYQYEGKKLDQALLEVNKRHPVTDKSEVIEFKNASKAIFKIIL